MTNVVSVTSLQFNFLFHLIFISDKTVSFIVPCRKGGYLIGLGQTVSHFDWDTKKVTTLASVDEGKKTRFNDAKCDASGRLWCGKFIFFSSPELL